MTIPTPFRIALAFLGVVLVAYFTAIAAMRTRWFHRWVEQRVVASLQSLTGARVALDHLDIHAASFEIDIRGLTLRGREGFLNQPLLSARLVAVRVHPLSVFFPKLWISWLYASGVELHCITYPDGSTNIPGALSGEKEVASKLAAVSIGTLELRDADLYWNNHKIRLDLTARGIALLLYFNTLRGYWGNCSLSLLQLRGPSGLSPPLTLAAHMRIAQHVVALSDLVWRAPGASGQGLARIAWAPRLEASARLWARGDLHELTRILGWNGVQRGQFQGKCRATYHDGRLTSQGQLQADDVWLRIPGLRPDRIDFASEFSADRKNLVLSGLRVLTLGGWISGQGQIHLKTPVPQFSFDVRLLRLNMNQALAVVPGGETVAKLLSLDSKINGTARVSWAGNLHDVRSRFDVQLIPPRRLQAGLRPLAGSLRGSAHLSASFVTDLDQVQLRTLHSVLTARGDLGTAQSSLQIHSSTTDFGEAEPLLEYITAINRPIPLQLRSPMIFNGMVTGPESAPAIRGQIAANAFSYRGWDWSGFSGSLDASPDHLRVSGGRLRSGPSVFSFQGSITLADGKVKPDSAVTLVAQAKQSPLEGLQEALGVRYPVTGRATGRLQLTGTVSDLSGTTKLRITDGKLYHEPFDLISAQGVIKNSDWDFRRILIKKGSGTATGGLQVDWPRRSFSAEFHGADFLLTQFHVLRRRRPASSLPSKAPWIGGKADFQFHGSGTLSDPGGQLLLDIRNVELNGSPAGEFQARMGLAERRLQAEGRLAGPGAELASFTLDARTQQRWPANMRGQFTNLHLDPWMRWLGAAYSEVPMTVSGYCTGKGPLRDPAKFKLEARAQALTLRAPDFVLKNDQPVEVHYAGGFLYSNVFRMRGPSTNVAVRMSTSLLTQPALSLAIHGDAQASVLTLFNPSIDAAGSFGLNVSVSGPLAQPALAGEIQIRNLSLRYGDVPVTLAGINGKIALKGNQATIVSLNGASGESVIQVNGSATITSPVIYDLSAHFQNLRLDYPVDFSSLLNGELHLAGSSQQSRLSGDITVQQMFASENFNIVDWVGQIGSALSPAPAEETTGTGSKIRVDVRVISNPEIRLSSRTLSFEALVDATVRGTAAHPVIMGDIRVQQGQALIAGNHYQILRGDIAMTNPFETSPILDIEAQTRVDTYNLMVDVTGPADHAKLAYRSDPPLPTEAILSLLALGYAPQQQLMSSTGAQPFGTLGASALLSQALSSQVSGRVQQLFGISRIRIDPNVLGPTIAGGARVTVEEQLPHNLTITYSTNTAAAQQRDIRVEWNLSNRISLIGEQDINGVYGFEIRFRRRLK